jgi:Immunity protein 26
LEEALFAFYDIKTSHDIPLTEVESKPILFKIWVMRNSVGSGRLEIVGVKSLEDDLRGQPNFFKIDTLSKRIGIYHRGTERPATVKECEGLECAAVWSAVHVEDRLRDHFLGRPNKWVEFMKIKKEKGS